MIKNNKKLDLVFDILSLIISFGIALFNLIIGVKYNALYNSTISIYMFCFLILNLIFFIFKIKNIEINKTIFIILNIFIIFTNLTLIVPIILLLLNKKEVNYGIIIGLSMATFLTYKIISRSIGFKRSFKTDSLLIKYKNLIGFNDCLISILVLEYSLIVINDGSVNDDMLILSLIVSICVFIVINVLTILFFIKNANRFIEPIKGEIK